MTTAYASQVQKEEIRNQSAKGAYRNQSAKGGNQESKCKRRKSGIKVQKEGNSFQGDSIKFEVSGFKL